MKKIITIFYLLFCTFLFTNVNAQTVVGGLSGSDLADIIAGEGVTITNVVLNCPGNASGSFINGNSSNIGLNEGVLLTSGSISQAFGVNNDGSSSINNGGGGDADLSAASGFTTYNACVLEFDFVPSANGLSVDFVFASEEYNEYVCSQFNDVFAFYVTGPDPNNYPGPGYINQDIALVPGVGSPITINTINNGSPGGFANGSPCDLGNSAFYTDNTGGTTVQWDGFTVSLAASLDLVPCELYHFKFAIADASDAILDSGVFLEAASFQTNNITATATDSPEGCSGGEITFVSPLPNVTGYTIDINVLGSSTASSSDYASFALNYVLPMGQQSLTVPIVSIADILNEGNETIDFEFTYDAGCDPTTSNASISIIDGPITCNDFVLLLDSDGTGSITADNVLTGDLNADCPSFDIVLSKDYFVCSDEGDNIVTVVADDGNGNISTCDATVTVQVPPGILTIDLGDDCRPVYWGYEPLECTDITANVFGGTPPYSYAWSNGETSQTITVCPTTTTYYDVTVTDVNGCDEISQTVEVEVIDVRCGKKLDKVLVCHVPPGNPENQHNICISPSAVPAHLAQGCYLGTCGYFPCDSINPKKSGDDSSDQSRLYTDLKGQEIVVYPNPTNSGVYLLLTELGDVERIEIFNTSGSSVTKEPILYNGEKQIYIEETNMLDHGIYLIKVTTKNGKVFVKRFVKSNW